MRRKVTRGVFLAVLGIFSLAAFAAADTLEMRDGTLIHGKFLGASEYHVRFLVNGEQKEYAVKDILNISFEDSGAAAAPALAPAQNLAPGAASTVSGSVTIPAGTRLTVRMIDGIDSATNKVGDQFTASLEDPLVVGDTVVAPKGTDVYGRLAEAKAAGHIAGRSELRLELTGIRINGSTQPVVTSDYDVSGKSRGKQSAERIGGGAALGAIIGAIAGGGKGAAIGAGVGAGAGTAIQVLTHGDQVRVPSETLLEFKLEQPLTVTPSSH